MSDLRLILIGLGLLILVVIYFSSVISNRRYIRSRTEKIASRDTDDAINIRISAKLDDTDPGPELEKFVREMEADLLNTESFKLEKEPDTVDTEEDNERKGSHPDELIIIYLKARDKNKWSGDMIFPAVQAAGMQFGAMDIFHFNFTDKNESETPVFSLASMIEPGIFDLQKPESTLTPGLVLFMQLPLPYDHVEVFDQMCQVAETIAEALQGELYDRDFNLLDSRKIQKIRDRL